jgi:excisionase family DNA binding protein
MTRPTSHPQQRTRLALSVDEASAALGVSRDYFDKHVIHELRVIRIGRRILVPTSELGRWIERSASRILDA